jgi:hypothetical protein
MKHTAKILASLFLPALIISCSNEAVINSEYIPAPRSYSDSTMWHIEKNDNGNGCDVFYIPSTWEFDWYTSDSVISHYADVNNPTHIANMEIEMAKTAEYMADGNNYYSPYYRHISLDSWATLNEDTISRRYKDVAFIDIKNAFDYFINNYNNERPFIIAGFSQGGKSVVELMKVMPENVRKRMIAAYVLGYKITPDDAAVAPWIKAAADSTDVGVTISYNSVSDLKYIKDVVSTPNIMAINPVNWRTDSTPATLQDSITVTLNTEHNVLVVKGYDGSSLPNILDVFNVGDYHGVEPWLYSECLRKNMKLRTQSYRNQNK